MTSEFLWREYHHMIDTPQIHIALSSIPLPFPPLLSLSVSLLHCKEDLIYVFPEMKLHGLVPCFYIHVSVSDLYIPKILGIYKSLTGT